MIYLYSGTPGSGKSLHQASVMEAWLKLGKPVIANYAFNTSLIKRCRGEFTEVNIYELSPKFLKEYSKNYFKNHTFREGTIRLFIDEAQLIFNSRDWSQKGRAEWLEFFTQHRHYGYDVYLIAQFDRMLDRQIRSLIEYEIIHRKIKNFGLKGQILNLLAGGGLFVSVKVWYPMKERVGSDFFRYNKRLGNLYNSYSDFSEAEIKQNKNTAEEEQEVMEFNELVKLFSAS